MNLIDPEVEALLPKYLETRNPDIKNQIIEGCRKLVCSVAKNIFNSVPKGVVGLNDLRQAGFLRIVQELDKYDPKHGANLQTFLSLRVVGAMMDELRANNFISRNQVQYMRQFRELEHKIGRRLTSSDFDDPKFRKQYGLRDCHKLAFEIGQASFSTYTKQTDPIDPRSVKLASDNEIRRLVRFALDTLPNRREKLLLVLYFIEGLTLGETGAALGVTESRASQIKTQALEMLRARLPIKRKSYALCID